MMIQPDHFTLTNFEGSLDFLLCLLQKEEIDIYDVEIQDLIQQFIFKLSQHDETNFEKGSEFIGIAAHLVWLKSKTLLPLEPSTEDDDERMEDPHFEIIHHLLDYCRFKQAAKDLALRQEKQKACYFRGVEVPEWKKPLGIDHVSLEELSQLFKTMMTKASLSTVQIQEEHWRVSDKMRHIRHVLKEQTFFSIHSLITFQQTKPEMIVIFLAILELMKIGELLVGRHQDSTELFIYAKKEKKE